MHLQNPNSNVFRGDPSANVLRFLEAHPEIQDWVRAIESKPEVHGKNSFVRDVLGKFWHYGTLSIRQLDAIRRSLKQDEERALDYANAGPAPEGRQVVHGIVLSTKPSRNVLKGLLKIENKSRVWVTVPDDTEVGERLAIKATWKVSKDDPKFAFGSRSEVCFLVED